MHLLDLCFLGLAVLPAGAEDESADRILTGGRILTVDAEDRVVEALAIRKGRILATGTTAEIERLAGPATERIDLAGRAADLDPVTAGHPAWLVQTSGHYGVANSEALRIAGITRETADPPGGTIDRDAENRDASHFPEIGEH
jgi:predicted amidohydrolase YtcJ